MRIRPLLLIVFLLGVTRCAMAQDTPPDKFTRAVAGIDVTGASSQATRADAFVDFNLTASLGHNFWLWVNPRIASVPQQASTALTTVTTSSPSFNSLLNLQYSQLIQSFESSGGAEFDFWKPGIKDYDKQDTSVVLAAVVGAGFSTPLAVTQSNVENFSLPSNLTASQLTQIFGKNVPGQICSTAVTTSCVSTVAFVPPDRTRFYKQYYAGLRLKSYYYGGTDDQNDWSGLCDVSANGDQKFCPIFPGTVDVTFGQNEAYSGGNLHGWLLRTEVFYPLWFNPAFHLFFTGWIHLDRHHEINSLVPIVLSPTTTLPTDPTQIQQVPLGTVNRDFYRIGVGVDLISLINHFKNDSAKR